MIRIIASNLHVGGGVQVAASLIDEFARMADEPQWADTVASLQVEVSTEVQRNLTSSTRERLVIDVRDRRPSQVVSKVRELGRRSDTLFVVFGPTYSPFRSRHAVMGYADVTSVYPPAVPVSTWLARLRLGLRARLSRWEASRQDILVVETVAMAEQVRRVLGARAPATVVVPNAVNARVLLSPDSPPLRTILERASVAHDLVLAYPTRHYPHKNLGLLPALSHALAAYGVSVGLVVTLRDEEWAAQAPDFRSACLNVGELTVEEMATLMRCVDGILFPSLLEAYSATPLEALASGTPLYASDRDFVKLLCGDAATYFDPADPVAAARAIFEAHFNKDARLSRVRSGLELAGRQPSARDRAEVILALLTRPTAD